VRGLLAEVVDQTAASRRQGTPGHDPTVLSLGVIGHGTDQRHLFIRRGHREPDRALERRIVADVMIGR
jgi:hypothetical protein